MRAPPPVVVDVSTGALWPAGQGALNGIAAAAAVAWTGLYLEQGGATVAMTALLAGAGVALVAFRFTRQGPTRLGWSGAHWFLVEPGRAEEAVVQPAVMLDLGGWMLLRLERAGRRAAWLPVARDGAGAAWPPFRAAVYSSASGLSPRSAPERPPF